MKRSRQNKASQKADLTKRLIRDAQEVLAKKGIEIESSAVLDILSGAGCAIVEETRKGHKATVARIPHDLVEHSLNAVPKAIDLYTAEGDLKVSLGKNGRVFSTGSSGTIYCDARTGNRPSTAADLGTFIRVADYLDHVHMVSTAMVPNDIDPTIQDAYRLLEVFKNSVKPVVTGIFPQAARNNFERMKDMLIVVRGSEKALREKPLAIFDCAPDPLKWSRTLGECIIECGAYGVPVEFVSMPQPGLSYPATLYEAVVQSVAETLAGIVISQAANEHAPVIWGGSPMTINFERGRTDAELSSPGTIKMITACVSVANAYGVPTHTYAISDSPIIDAQYGIEKQRVISAAMRAGIDHITGLGMFGEEDVLSCEALVIDNDIAGAESYMDMGIEQKRTDAAADISFLADEAVIDPETVGYLRSDEYFVPRVFNRDRSKPMLNRAIEAVEDILARYNPEYLSGEQQRGLESCLAQPNN